jgi:hypothetical protein
LNTIERFAGDTKALPKELIDFARRQVVNATLYKGDERRSEGRHPMMLPVRAVQVDDENQPLGPSFDLITRDLSSKSISLIHTDRIDCDRLAIHFFIAGTDVNLVIELVWSGEMGPFYGAAGRFVVKLDEFPA